MIPPSVKATSKNTLPIFEKAVKKSKKNHASPQGKASEQFCRSVRDNCRKHRSEFKKVLSEQLASGETFICARFKPHRDELIFRKPGESLCEWRIRQHDILKFILEDWFEESAPADLKNRGPVAIFGMASKEKLEGTLVHEVRDMLAHRKALWETHQKLCGCRWKRKARIEALVMRSGEEQVKDGDTGSQDTREMDIA